MFQATDTLATVVALAFAWVAAGSVATLATRNAIVFTSWASYSALAMLIAALLFVGGCASTSPPPRPMQTAYDPSRSYAGNVAAAAGLTIPDSEGADLGSADIVDSLRTVGFLTTTTLRPATFITRPGAFGLGLLSSLSRPQTIPLEASTQILVWAPIDSVTGDEPIEKYWLNRVARAVFDARASTLPAAYSQTNEPEFRQTPRPQNLMEQINNVDVGSGIHIEMPIEGPDCGVEDIRCSDRMVTSMPSFSQNVPAPDFLDDDRQRTLIPVFLSPTFQQYTGYRSLFHPRFNDLDTILRASQTLPSFVYFYIAPNRLAYFDADTSIYDLIRVPLIIHQGQIYPFVSPS